MSPLPLETLAWTTAWVRKTPFGTLAAVHLPQQSADVAHAVLDSLAAEERAFAATLAGYKKLDWVGGRLAWHAARLALGVPMVALVTGEGGGPVAPSGLTVSVSHKRGLAVALVGAAERGTLGVDLEGGPARMAVATRVLTARELRDVQALPEDAQWPAVQLRFSMKEAVYKAIHPHLQRYVGFDECDIDLRGERDTTATLTVREGEPSLSLACVWDRWESWVICQVRATRV